MACNVKLTNFLRFHKVLEHVYLVSASQSVVQGPTGGNRGVTNRRTFQYI